MGLPGGRKDPDDEHLLTTAIRETHEEVGIPLAPASLLGQLDDVAPRSKTQVPVFARPFVFAIDGQPPPAPNDEVSTARWVPLSTFSDPANLRDFTLEIGGVSRTFPGFHLEEGTVWGMTERVLTSLFSIIRNPS